MRLSFDNIHGEIGYYFLTVEGYDAHLIMQVHDELIIESNKNCAAKVAELLKTEMENVITLPVKLTAEVSTGKTWFDAK